MPHINLTCVRCSAAFSLPPSQAATRKFCSSACYWAAAKGARSGTRLQPNKPCITCGGPRDQMYAYTTAQGRRSVRYESRCRSCSAQRRAERHAKDPERSYQDSRRWKARNPNWGPEYNRRRQQDPKVRALKAYHQRLRKARMRSGQPDDPEIRAIYRQAKDMERLIAACPVFALPELGYELQVDHIIPLARGGQHVASNLQVLPKGLNMRKGVKCPK